MIRSSQVPPRQIRMTDDDGVREIGFS